MREVIFHGRKAAQIDNRELRISVTREGGHVAELLHKKTGISPLWIPHWRSIEPSEFSAAHHAEYGNGAESKLVAGLLGHNICLDLFGAPEASEAAAGIPVHGEAPVATYDVTGDADSLSVACDLPRAELGFERTMQLADDVLVFSESVENRSCTDRPIGWTQHVTLGAPFLERASTRFAVSSTRGKVYEAGFNNGLGMQLDGAEFDWPLCPRKDGNADDLSIFPAEERSGGFTAHLMDAHESHAFFVSWSPRYRLAFGYVWSREDFPWLSRWEENHLRPWAPWNSEGFALGMEFGVSPMVESRRKMVERGPMFGTPTFRWLPAQSTYNVRYCAFLREAEAMPKSVRWDGERAVQLEF